jgi:signal transduction histidine kinase
MKSTGITLAAKDSALYELVDKLIRTSSIVTKRNRSFIINDVPEGLAVMADENILSAIISGLLQSVVNHARDTCIRISAKTYNDVVLMHVKDANGCNNEGISYGVQQVQHLALKMGGFLDVTSYRRRETTITFTFPNLKVTAAA